VRPPAAATDAHVSATTTRCQALHVEIVKGAATPGGLTRYPEANDAAKAAAARGESFMVGKLMMRS